MKKTLSIINILVLILIMVPSAKAQTRASFSETNAPSQKYTTADTVDWSVNLKNGEITKSTRALVILKDTVSRKRVILGGVRLEPGQSKVDFEWRIDQNKFESRGIDLEDGLYRLSLRARVNGKWARGYSKRFRISKPDLVVSQSNDDEDEVENVSEPETTTPEPISSVITPDMKLVALYNFTATLEPWEVRKLTIVNDTDDDGFDYDISESTSAVKDIALRYPDLNGNLVEIKKPFSGTRLIFSNLKFHIPRDQAANIEIWASLVDENEIDENISGQIFQLGIQDTNNSANNYEAIGLISNSVDNFLNELTLSSQLTNNEFIVRKVSPIFEVLTPHSRTLTTGSNDVFEFKVSPSNNNPLSLAKLVLDVTQNDVGTIDQVELFRSGNKLTPGNAVSGNQVYLMWNTGGGSCFAHTTDGMNCAGGTNNLSKLIITFPQTEIISGPTTYKIRLSTSSVGENASLQVAFATGDEQSKPSIGGTISTTGSIYNNTGANELFGTNTDFVSGSISNRNIIWSDRTQLGSHKFPTITPAASPTTGTDSSTDFTNGYLLKINQLPAINSER